MKTLTLLTVALAVSIAFAALHRPPIVYHASRPVHRTIYPYPIHHYRHHHSGELFWAGLGTGLIIDAVLKPTPPPPVVVGPVANPPRIWVPPVYDKRPVFDANIIRYEYVIIREGYWR